MAQVTLNKSQLIQLIKLGLINEERFSECTVQEKSGDYNDRDGNKVIRSTIIVPDNDSTTVSVTDYLDVASNENMETPNVGNTDDLEKEINVNS